MLSHEAERRKRCRQHDRGPSMSVAEAIDWREVEEGKLVPYHVREGKEDILAAWAPQPGSQMSFITCPVFECLYEGERGLGKTDNLIMDFAREVGAGWGSEWRGILFRRTYKELEDVIEKTKKWYPKIFPGAEYNESKFTWNFPDGETLLLRHFDKPAIYWSYHGHNYTWIGWEELTVWPTDECYTSMFSCARSTVPGIPIRVRATTNPYGVGHNWVKRRFRLPISGGHHTGRIIKDSRDRHGELEPWRVAIHGRLMENKVLLLADPTYLQRLKAAARNEAQYKAWIDGDWNIVAGGMLDDVWDVNVHVVPNFPTHLIPKQWRIDRSYDHGSSAPFSVGWWAESNGEPFTYNGVTYGTVPGDLYRFAEWYGWNGQDNEGLRMLATEIARGILDREDDMGLTGRVLPGPADSSIYDDAPSGGKSVADDMASVGVKWKKADKSPGSRKQGWEQIRKMLKAGIKHPREYPGLFVTERCEQFQRTVPVLPRSEKDMDDVDTSSEDHVGDETRYKVRMKRRRVRSGSF